MRAPGLLKFGEDAIDGCDVLDIAGQQQLRAERIGQRLDALAEGLALIGEGQFGAMRMELLRDAPGNRVIVRDAHHQAAVARHQRFGHAGQPL